MPASPSWMPPHSVLFAIALCLMMVGGDVFAEAVPRIGNPAKFAFYSFLPVALWMMAGERQRDLRTIGDLEVRIQRLEEALRSTGRSPSGSAAAPTHPDS